MAEGCVIGVDLGGTKLLAGAVDQDGTVHHRTNRPALGLDQLELVEMVAHAVEGVRRSVGVEVEAVGFGIPCTFDARTGLAVQAVNLPLRDIRFADVMAERLELPVVVDNDANCAVLAEARAGAGAGCSEVVMLTLGTGIGSGMVLRGEVYRGFAGGGAEIGHMVVDMDGRPCQGNCPNSGCLESVASGTALVREVSLAVARRPDTEHRPRDGGRARADRADGHGDGPRRRPRGARGDRDDRPRARRRARQHREHLLPAGRSSSAAASAPRATSSSTPAREVMARRALAPGRDEVRIEAAAFGAEAGMIGAAMLARERPSDVPSAAGPAAGGGRVSTGGRLVVCPTPIGNLEDVTLRVLAALREADVVACEDTRRTRVLLERYGVQARLVSYHEHNERERAAELVERMSGGEVVALVSDAGMPLVSDPGYVLVQGCVAAGLSVEVLPGPSAALAALVASALPSDAWRFAGFLPRKRAALLGCSTPRRPWSRSSRRGGWGRRSPRSPRSTRRARSRSAASSRSSTRRSCAGRRPSSPRATPTRAPAARSCSSSAAPRRARAPTPPRSTRSGG